MHYALLSYGSMGDVRPFVALAIGLQQHGHRVTLAAPENFRAFVETYGIAFFPLPGNIEERVKAPEVIRLVSSRDNLSFLIGLLKASDDLRPAIFQAVLDLSRQADVLLTSTLNIFYVDAIAQHLGKPWAMLLPSPPMTETAAYPFADMDFFNFPWYNRLTYRLATFAFWQVYKKRIHEARTSLGLSDRPSNPLRAYIKEKIPVLYVFSPRLIPRPQDWSDNCQVTGYLTLEESQPPDQSISTWLRSGKPPIYIGFGSIPIPKPGLVSAAIVAILDATDHRIVFCKGWSDLPELPIHPNLFVIERADHRWLLPQCMVAIHHGGAGTVAAALMAGIPSIVLSMFGDQPQWGKIVQRRGVGLHLPFRRLTAKKLLRAIEKAGSPPILGQAARLGAEVNAEDGVRTTIETLTYFFNK
jgi:UDP:flavonoid glycosyltransferase YjiC (YdhE family)